MKTKKLLLSILIFTLCSLQCNAQDEPGIKMTSPEIKTDKAVLDLMSWQKIGYENVEFTGKDLKGKDYYLVSKEIWDGEIKKTDTLINTTSHMLFKKAEDTLKITVMTGKESEKKLRTQFDFGRFSLENTYESLPTDDYSMRTYGRLVAIEPNKPFYAFAYILPYEKDNGKYYCAVEGSGKDIESWGKLFNIKHYILFEMCFFDGPKDEDSKTQNFTIITN